MALSLCFLDLVSQTTSYTITWRPHIPVGCVGHAFGISNALLIVIAISTLYSTTYIEDILHVKCCC